MARISKIKAIVAIVGIAAFLGGCFPVATWQAACWPQAVYRAWTVMTQPGPDGKKHFARIAISKETDNTDHAMAQVFYDGKWRWLKQDGTTIYTDDKKDSWANGEIYKYIYPLSINALTIHIKPRAKAKTEKEVFFSK
jgi:hypothetical protein